MAIIRQTKNYIVVVKDKYQAIVNGKFDKYANKIIIDATDGDVNLNSNKKIVSNGGC